MKQERMMKYLEVIEYGFWITIIVDIKSNLLEIYEELSFRKY